MAFLRFIKRINSIIAKICYLIIIIYVLICIPYIFGYRPLVVLTGSMEPTYKIGSIIYYHKVPESDLKVGDPITFKLSNGTVVTHRINDINDNEYQTKGDANDTPDTLKIDYNNILGRVSNITIPLIGYGAYFIKTHNFLIGIALIILVSELVLNNILAFDIDKNRKERNKNGKTRKEN